MCSVSPYAPVANGRRLTDCCVVWQQGRAVQGSAVQCSAEGDRRDQNYCKPAAVLYSTVLYCMEEENEDGGIDVARRLSVCRRPPSCRVLEETAGLIPISYHQIAILQVESSLENPSRSFSRSQNWVVW